MNANPQALAAAAAPDIARAFVAWQCRLRQHAVRRGDGRPSAGMTPRVSGESGLQLDAVTTVLVRRDAAADAARFRQIFSSTRSPLERYEGVMTTFQSEYFQHPDTFSDRLTALFLPTSTAAAELVGGATCILDFFQFGQRYCYRASVRHLPADCAAAQATWWHNRLFNPRLPAAAEILEFEPDWDQARAEPPAIPATARSPAGHDGA